MKKTILITLVALLQFYGMTSAQQQLTLAECKALALKNNVRVANSQLAVESARLTKKSAFTSYFPSISAGGVKFEAKENLMEMQTTGGNLPVYDGNPLNLMSPTQFAYFPSTTTGLLKKGTMAYVNAIQPVFAGGRIYNGNRLATLGVEVQEAQVRLAKEEVLLKTEEQFWLLIALDEKSKTLHAYETLLLELMKQVEDAFRSGVVLKNDVLKVQLKLSEVRLNTVKLQNGRNLAAMAFSQYIGVPYDTSMVFVSSEQDVAVPASFYTEHAGALEKRAEYDLLHKGVEAEELQTNMKLGSYLPEAGIGVSGVYQKFDEGKGRKIGLVFGTVAIPISGWWGGMYDLQERHVKEKIALNQLKDNSELLVLQMQKEMVDMNDAYKQYLLNLEAKTQGEENLKVNEDSYKNGMITISDLLEAQALLQQTQDNLVDAKTQYKQKVSRYLRVTGRGLL